MPMIWLADIPRLTGPIAAPGVIIAGVISSAVTGPAARSNPKIAAARARTICGFSIFTQCAAIACTPAPYEADNRRMAGRGVRGGCINKETLRSPRKVSPLPLRQPGRLASVAGLSRGFASPDLSGFAPTEARSNYTTLYNQKQYTKSAFECQGN